MMMESYYYSIPVTCVLGVLLMYIIQKIYSWWSTKGNGLSEEEANYIRYLHLLLDLGAKALRQYFDSNISPHQLKSHLAKYEKDRRTMKQWGFTKPQLDTLFPANPTTLVSSSAFDASLMYKLIRNTFPVPPPTQGWGKDPLAEDISLTDDVERIRIHRNYLAHINDPAVSNKEFQDRWDDLSQAIKRLSYNTQWKNICKLRIKTFTSNSREEAVKLHADHIAVLSEVDGLKTDIKSVNTVMSSISQDVSALKTDLKELDSFYILKNVREQHNKIVMKWFKEDIVYYETTQSQSAMMFARSQSYLTIVGGPGTGKTATMRHVALLLAKEDYIITPISDIKEIIQFGQVNKKHLFLIDDVLGAFGLQIEKYNKVTDNEEHIFNVLDKTSKLLMTCRKSVYNEALKYKSFVTIAENVIDLEGENNKLTDSEKKEICKSHCTFAGVEKEVYENLKFDFEIGMFPLLCKFFANDVKYHAIGSHFFEYPYKCISKEIDRLQVHSPLHYAALVMCAINRNKLSEDVLNRSELTHLKTDILKTCEVKSSTESWEIAKALSSEDGTYTTKIENDFTLIHDFMFEVITCHYGKQNPDHILKYMSSSFICEKVRVSKRDLSDEDLTINIQEKHYRLLAERLYKDISDMNLQDVFMNKCLYDENFCEFFIQILESKSYEEIKSMFICKREDEKKIVSKGWSVSERLSGRERWFENEKLLLLVDERHISSKSDIFHMYITYNIRVVSWIVLYGHINILLYIMNKVTSAGESVDLVFGCNKEEQTRLLVLGCWSGNEDLVQIIINNVGLMNLNCGLTCDQRCFDTHICYKPLTAACLGGHLNIVIKLIESGCDIFKDDDFGHTPLTAACRGGHINIITKLIESGCDINKADHHKLTPLTAACRGGHLNIVSKLIESGCEINKADYFKLTPLTVACQSGHLNIVTKLIESGCEINKIDYFKLTPLTAACQSGYLNIVTKLIESGCEINKVDYCKLTPLTAACQGGYLNIVTKLIESGCDINNDNNVGHTPLTAACESGHQNIVIKLIESGCDVNKVNNFELTPLTTACRSGHLNIVTELIKSGCDINKVDSFNLTPLTAACECGHLNIVTKLIESGCDINKVNNLGHTSLTAACERGHLNIVTKLIESECDINKGNNIGHTPLTTACRRGHLNIVTKLIESGCDINKVDNIGHTSLTAACESGNLNIVTKLVESGCDINKANNFGHTPLTAACQGGHLNIVTKLIESGCDVNKVNNLGQTPLTSAFRSGYRDIVAKLLESGCTANI